MTAIRFVLTALDTGRLLGQAVICTEARYCSVAWASGGRLERRYVDGPGWRDMEAEVARNLPPTPLPTSSPITVALLDFGKRSSIAVQYMHATPVEASPGDVSAVLDGMLRQGGDLAQ